MRRPIELSGRRLTRRAALRFGLVSLGTLSLGVACQQAAAPSPTSAPAATAKPAATTAPAAAATQAPAAAATQAPPAGTPVAGIPRAKSNAKLDGKLQILQHHNGDLQ